MAYPQGINFRESLGYVTDGANYDAELTPTGEDTYPRTTAQGNNVGWESPDGSEYQHRDRNAGNDPRLAGCHFYQADIDLVYRLDLPAPGNYNIGLAAGDASYACACPVDLEDTASSLGSLTTGSTSGSQRFKDATNTELTNVTWPTNQALVPKTFSTTICRFRLVGDPGFSRIASLYVESAEAGPTPSLTRLTASPLRWR